MRKIVAFTLALAGVAQALAAEQRTDKILIQGNPAGTQTVQVEAGGVVRVEYSYNDRGRGDHIVATWKLDAAGVPIQYEGKGNDYMKAPVEERFEMKNGKASWKNRSEQGEQAVTGAAFYLPMNAPPEFSAVLARALLKAPNRKLPLLPAGEASIEAAGKVNTGKAELTEYRITGLGFSPAIDLARAGRNRVVGLRLVLGRARWIGGGDSAVASSAGKNRRRLVGTHRPRPGEKTGRRSRYPERPIVRSARSQRHTGQQRPDPG